MKKLILVASLVLPIGCAGSVHQTATRVATASKGVVDVGGNGWAAYVDRQIEHCRAKQLPTPDDRAACLGPAAEAKTVTTIFESIHAAQLALWIVLADPDASDDEIRGALGDLLGKVKALRPYLQQAGLTGSGD